MPIRRKILFYFVVLTSVYLLIELSAFLLLLKFGPGTDSISRVRKYLVESNASAIEVAINREQDIRAGKHWRTQFVPHPYLGFVHNTGIYKEQDWLFSDARSNFDESKVNVLIVGGSVAYELGGSLNVLEEYLKKKPKYENKEIVFYPLAVRAFKQPQQLFSVLYFTSAVGVPDVVLNIDGFNEVGLETFYGFTEGIGTPYPQLWADLSRQYNKAEDVLIQLERLNAIQSRSRAAKLFSHFKYSYTADAIWYFLDKYYERIITNKKFDLVETNRFIKGPKPPEESEEYFNDVINIWYESSIKMEKLSSSFGFDYYQFLQPNQYLPGSKPLDEETKQGYTNYEILETKIAKYYPILQSKGVQLKMHGVDFFDATQIFQDEVQVLYRDNCCHLNDTGNEILANYIGRKILEE